MSNILTSKSCRRDVNWAIFFKNMNILTGAWLASRYFPVIYPVAANLFSVTRARYVRLFCVQILSQGCELSNLLQEHEYCNGRMARTLLCFTQSQQIYSVWPVQCMSDILTSKSCRRDVNWVIFFKNMNILTGAWLASCYFPVIYPVAANIFSVTRARYVRLFGLQILSQGCKLSNLLQEHEYFNRRMARESLFSRDLPSRTKYIQCDPRKVCQTFWRPNPVPGMWIEQSSSRTWIL